MTPDVKRVRRVLRSLDLEPERRGKPTRHELWGDGNGRTVELAKKGTYVPEKFVHALAWELDKKGICPAREFKRLIRKGTV
jgi:hypothetical protein